MQSTPAPARQPHASCFGSIGFLMLCLLSGCGLAMDNEDRLVRGEQAFADGEYRAAVIDAKNILLEEPDNVAARLLLGRVSVEIGDGAAAEKELRRAMQLGASPAAVVVELARALLLQRKFAEVLDEIILDGLASSDIESTVRRIHGDAYLGLNKPELARDMYSSALLLQPDSLDARLGMVSSFVAERNFAQARGAIDHILETNADNPRVWLYSGSLNARLRDFENAAANYQVALDRADALSDGASRLQALAGLAESFLGQQEVERARRQIDLLATEAPESFPTKLLIARLAYIDEDWMTAQQNLLQILRAAPDFRPAQVLLGAVHLSSGSLAQAEMYLSAAVAAEPGDVIARRMLAETQLQMNKAEDAQESLAPIVSEPNADLVSLNMAARASLGRRDIGEALGYLRRGVEENPDNVDLRFQLAATLLEVGRTDEAQAVLDDVDVSDSEEHAYRRDALGVLRAMRDGQAAAALQAARQVAGTFADRGASFNLLGAVQLANKDLDGAKVSFERALELDPTGVVSRRYLAAIDESTGDLATAASHYAKIVADDADATWATFALGRIASRQEDYQQAAEHFRRASIAEPENTVYRLNLAKAERQLDNGSKAVQVLEDKIEASLDHIPSAIMLAVLRAEAGDLEGAMDVAKQLLLRYPDNPASHAFEGEIHLLSKNLVLADAAYEKALSLGPIRGHALRAYQIKRKLGVTGAQGPLAAYLKVRPLDNEVRVVLAESYMQIDDLTKAIAAYERVVSDEPENAVALNNLAWAYSLVDDPRAIETAKKAHDAMPDNGAIVDTLGWIMISQGFDEEGEDLLRKAVALENGRAEIRYHHAVALAKLGKYDEARAALQEILAGDEGFAGRKDAEKLLAEL